ncbi:MAG TPA: hypothetical protein VE863_00625 [Pyrinomonadaceae bacterium]|nr:hypothetical protein [Pyrinomonadaceae bacterium]
MKSKSRNCFVTMVELVLISLVLFVGPILHVERSTAQSPPQTLIKPLETPCAGGTLLVSQSYSECGLTVSGT